MRGSAGREKPLAERLGHQKDSILVIVHIDDLGMHADETAGSLATLSFGLAKSGSAMVPAPDFSRFASIWKSDPSLDIGVHATLTSEWNDYRWAPLLSQNEAPSLRDPEGFMWKRESSLLQNADLGQARREMRAQVEKVLEMGFRPTHLDAHMNSYLLHPSLLDEAVQIARDHNLVLPYLPPERKPELTAKGFVSADSSNGIYVLAGEEHSPHARRDAYYSWLRNLHAGVHFIFTHPAEVTPALAKIVEMPYVRSGDREIWTSVETKELCERLGITFIGMRELQELQAESLGRGE